MHSYTLSNWDGSQTEAEVGRRNPNPIDKHKKAVSQGRDGSIFSSTSGNGSISNGGRAGDAYGSQTRTGPPPPRVVEGTGSPHETMVNTKTLQTRDIAISMVEQGNQAANDLASLYSQLSATASPQPKQRERTSKTHSNGAHNPVAVVNSSRSQRSLAKAISGTPARISSSTTSSVVPSKPQIPRLPPNLRFTRNPSDHTQDTFNSPSSIQSSKSIHEAAAEQSKSFHPVYNKLSHRKQESPSIKPVSGTLNLNGTMSTPSLSNPNSALAIPNTVPSQFRPVKPKQSNKQASRPTVSAYTSPIATNNHRTPPTQHPLVATQNRRKLTTTVTQPIARPPTQANHEPSPRYRQPPKPSASSASSASPASSAGDNHASKKLPSIPAPSIIHHDPRFSSVHQSHKSDDESTSADADGESVEDLDFESLLPSQSGSQIESVLSSFAPTPTSTSVNSLVTNTQRTKIEHASVYDLFTPPPTRSPSQQLPSEPNGTTSKPRPQVFQFLWVEVPPLPPGKHRADYRPVKRLKRAYGPESTRSLEVEDDDAEREITELERLRRERNRIKQRKRQERQRSLASQSHASSTFQQSMSASTSFSGYSVYQEQKQHKKSFLSNLSMRHPKGKSTKAVSSVETTASSRLHKAPSSSAPASASASREPPPPSTLSAHPGERIKASALTSSTSFKPKPRPAPVVNSDVSGELHFTTPPKKTRSPDIIQSAEHPSASVVYFNTRFAPAIPGINPVDWTALGALVKIKCVAPRAFIWDHDLVDDETEMTDRSSYNVGGPLSWKGCTSSDEDLPQALSRKGREWERQSVEPRSPERGRQPIFTGPSSAHDSSAASVPTLDLVQVLKEQKAASVKKYSKQNPDDATALGEDLTKSPNVRTTPGQKSRTQSSSVTSPLQPQKPSRYLSDKARGKQKAVEPDPLDITSTHSPPLHTSALPYTTSSYSPTNTGSPSFQAYNPHDDFDRGIANYLAFDTPDKHRDQNLGNITSTNGAGSSSITSGLESPNPFLSQPADDLFLVSSTLVSSTLVSPVPLNSFVGSFDSGRGLHSSVNSSFGFLDGEGEKDGQITTINPAILGGVEHSDDGLGVEDMDLDSEYELAGETGETTGEDMAIVRETGGASSNALKFLMDYQSDYSSSSFSPRLQSPPRSRSPQALVGRTPSPEFPQYDAGDFSSQDHATAPTQTRALHTSSHSSSVFVPRKPTSSRAKTLTVAGDEDEEERGVRQRYALELYESSDSDGRLSKSEALSRLRRPWQRASPVKNKPLAVKSRELLSKDRKSVPKQTKPTARRSKEEWPTGTEESYCHQCRHKTRRLKMICPCDKRFCNRCVGLRYPERLFCVELNEFDCPVCRGDCNCDLCCRKRGEEYISLQVSTLSFAQARKDLLPLAPSQSGSIRTPTPSPSLLDSPLLPDNVEDIPGPLSFWGTIYDSEGNKFANGFAGPGDNVIVANVMDGYTMTNQGHLGPNNVELDNEVEITTPREFIGACQPSWGLGKTPIIKEIGRRGRSRIVRDEEEQQGVTASRWFVGKERLLHWPVVAYTTSLKVFSDMSSLSSLSDVSDIEVDLELPAPVASPVSEHTTSNHFSDKMNATDCIKNTGEVSFDPAVIETKDTIRALINALEACGMIVKTGSEVENLYLRAGSELLS